MKRYVAAAAALGIALCACAAILGIDELPGPSDAGTSAEAAVPLGDGGDQGDAEEAGARDVAADGEPSAAQLACLSACKLVPGDAGCDAGTCVIDCRSDASACPSVRCPPGVPCSVLCGDNQCNGGVDCGDASSCAVTCEGYRACSTGPITCAGARCRVACSGKDTCFGGITCSARDRCEIVCRGADVCKDNPTTCYGADCTLDCAGNNVCNNGGWQFHSHADATTVFCDASGAGASNVCTGDLHCHSGAACTVRCSGNNACTNGLCCDSGACDPSGVSGSCP